MIRYCEPYVHRARPVGGRARATSVAPPKHDDNACADYLKTASNTAFSDTVEHRPSSQLSTRNSNDPRSPSDEDGSRSSRSLPPRHSGKRSTSEVDHTISVIGKRLMESNEDRHDVFGRNVAHKLRNLPNDQRIFLEKIINNAIFEAEMGNLNKNCCVHVPAQTSLNVAVNPPRTSIPKSHVSAQQNDNNDFDSNDLSCISQYIINYKP
ncbi:hypothetical protein ACJJTC_001870 [Scirpophaga incertulas]